MYQDFGDADTRQLACGLISLPSLWFDETPGEAEVFTTSNVAYDAATRRCTGACHGADHNDTW